MSDFDEMMLALIKGITGKDVKVGDESNLSDRDHAIMKSVGLNLLVTSVPWSIQRDRNLFLELCGEGYDLWRQSIPEELLSKLEAHHEKSVQEKTTTTTTPASTPVPDVP